MHEIYNEAAKPATSAHNILCLGHKFRNLKLTKVQPKRVYDLNCTTQNFWQFFHLIVGNCRKYMQWTSNNENNVFFKER